MDPRDQRHKEACTETDHYTAHCATCLRAFMAHSLQDLNDEIAEHQRTQHGG
jgi:hypothetical protein